MFLTIAAATSSTSGSDNTILIAVITASALVVGYVLNAITNWVTAKSTAAATSKLEADKQVAADKRESRQFQRETLLAVQTALTRYARSTAKIWMFDQEQLKQHGTITQMGTELDQESYAARLELTHLIARVLDDNLRSSLEGIAKVRDWMLHAKTLGEVNKGVTEFAPDLQATQDKLGATLRGYLTP